MLIAGPTESGNEKRNGMAGVTGRDRENIAGAIRKGMELQGQ